MIWFIGGLQEAYENDDVKKFFLEFVKHLGFKDFNVKQLI
jgi:hypothetical protein